jgi:hypothetical protein
VSPSPGAPGGTPRGPADPLAQRLLWAAGLLSVLLIAVVVNGLLNGGDEELSLNPIATAAERTQEAPGARIAIEAIYTSPALDTELVATGTGTYDARSGRSSMTLTLPVPGLGEMTFEAVGDARTLFMRSDMFESELPPGKEWISIDPWLGNNEAASMAGSVDAKGGLEMLEATSDDFESLGEETVDGVETSRYRTTIELGEYAEQLRAEGKAEAAELYERMATETPGPATSEVWVDSTNMIQRMRMVMELPAPDGGEAMTMDMRMDFTHLDAAPRIELPPRGEVVDMAPQVNAQLGVSGGEGSPNPDRPEPARPNPIRSRPNPAGEPLSAGAFRQRANAACVRGFDAAKPILARVEALSEEFERRSPELEGMRPAAAGREVEEFLAEFGRIMQPLRPIMEDLKGELEELAPPADLASRYERMLRIYSRELGLFAVMTRALQAFDKSTYSRVEAESDRLSAHSDRLALSLGLDDCVEKEADESGSGALS